MKEEKDECREVKRQYQHKKRGYTGTVYPTQLANAMLSAAGKGKKTREKQSKVEVQDICTLFILMVSNGSVYTRS